MLQGCSLHFLAVVKIHLKRSWIYLSLSGLLICKPLDLDQYAMSEDMINMICKFEELIELRLFENNEYKCIMK
jgi:hypothetical protein